MKTVRRWLWLCVMPAALSVDELCKKKWKISQAPISFLQWARAANNKCDEFSISFRSALFLFSSLSSGTILEKNNLVCDIVQLTEQVFAGEIPGAENCKEWKVLWIRCNFTTENSMIFTCDSNLIRAIATIHLSSSKHSITKLFASTTHTRALDSQKSSQTFYIFLIFFLFSKVLLSRNFACFLRAAYMTAVGMLQRRLIAASTAHFTL